MEISSKDIARTQWRSHQRKQVGRGGTNKGSQSGRGSGAGKHSRRTGNSELESNNFRYEQDEEHEDLPPGMPVRQSKGGDLEELLQEAAIQATGRFPRGSAFDCEEAVATEFLSAQRDADQSNPLAFDVTYLAKSLEALPLHELLGLEAELVPIELRGGTEHALQCDLEELTVGNQSDTRLPVPSISDHASTSPLSEAGRKRTDNTELSHTAAVEEAVQAEPSGETVARPAATIRDQHGSVRQAPVFDGCDAELDALLDAGIAHTSSIPQRGDTATGASETCPTQRGKANGNPSITAPSGAPVGVTTPPAGAGTTAGDGVDAELDALLGLRGLDNATVTPLSSSTAAVNNEVGHKSVPAVSDGGATMPPAKSKDEGNSESLDDWLDQMLG